MGLGNADDVSVDVMLNDVAVSVGSTEATTDDPSADGASVTRGSSTVHAVEDVAPAGSAEPDGMKLS